MAFRLTGATTPNWSISTTAGDSVPGSAYQFVSNPLVRDDLLLSGAGRVEVTNLGRWAWAHSRKGTKAGGQLFREGLLRHVESWRKSWLMTVFLAGEKCFDSTKEKFHRERKARIFRGWLCGFRTYFQYVYIYIYPYLLLQHLWLLEISFRLLRCKSAYKRCRVRCSQKLVTFGFKVLCWVVI